MPHADTPNPVSIITDDMYQCWVLYLVLHNRLLIYELKYGADVPVGRISCCNLIYCDLRMGIKGYQVTESTRGMLRNLEGKALGSGKYGMYGRVDRSQSGAWHLSPFRA